VGFSPCWVVSSAPFGELKLAAARCSVRHDRFPKTVKHTMSLRFQF